MFKVVLLYREELGPRLVSLAANRFTFLWKPVIEQAIGAVGIYQLLRTVKWNRNFTECELTLLCKDGLRQLAYFVQHRRAIRSSDSLIGEVAWNEPIDVRERCMSSQRLGKSGQPALASIDIP